MPSVRSIVAAVSTPLLGLAVGLGPLPAALAQNFLQSAQGEDGSWSAARWQGHADGDLRVHVWTMLAFLGDGSTTREGVHRDHVLAGMRWLHARQDRAGRFALRTSPDWLLDQAMATFLLCEDLRNGGLGGAPSTGPLAAAARALVHEVATRRPPAGAEVRLWCHWVVASLRRAVRDVDDGERRAELEKCAGALQEAIEALPLLSATDDPRKRAAVALLRDRSSGGAEADPEPLPEHASEDPLLTLYVVVQHFCRGGELWKATSKWIEREVVRTQRRQRGPDGELYGSWDPTGAFGEQYGRVGATALAVLTLEVYYRYIRLHLLGG